MLLRAGWGPSAFRGGGQGEGRVLGMVLDVGET